ncbi:MAG: polysaccharide deacetylase family protein [Hungatella sp.]|nr:polysaccharide deacetylase family protein [Hungatella sp.]
MALAAWGLAGLFLAADFFAEICPMPESGTLRKAAGAAVSASEGNMVRPGEQKEEKYIALTFDDGPHRLYTPRLLDGLKKRGVHATFFLIGQNIEGNEDIIRRMKEEGHLIGNHSQNHMQLTTEQTEEACDQINWTNEKIRSITGQMPVYVRPPFGSWSDDLESIVPMKVVLWSVDPLDWKTQNKDRIVRHIVSHAEDGGIILLHDVYGTSVEAALEVIDTLSAEGYNFVTVDELLID